MTDNLERAMALLDDVASGISATDAYQRGRIAERIMIVAMLRGETGYAWSKDVVEAADAIERGEHLT
jgi:hypothetical protein